MPNWLTHTILTDKTNKKAEETKRQKASSQYWDPNSSALFRCNSSELLQRKRAELFGSYRLPYLIQHFCSCSFGVLQLSVSSYAPMCHSTVPLFATPPCSAVQFSISPHPHAALCISLFCHTLVELKENFALPHPQAHFVSRSRDAFPETQCFKVYSFPRNFYNASYR